MRHRFLHKIALGCLLLGTVVPGQSPATVRLESINGRPVFRVSGLSAEWLARYRRAPAEIRKRTLAVYTVSPGDVPPLLGQSLIEDDSLTFRPRFGLTPGLSYRVVFNPGAPAGEDTPATVALFEIPAADRTPEATVEQVSPSAPTLPENLLKFYLHFSAPMSRGEAYRRVRLLDDSGRPVALPFLELDEELWDFEGRRLTLLFDPGRIKTGLLPRQVTGPALEQGRDYTLIVDRNWPDARGVPMRAGVRRTFRAGPADHDPPDPGHWKISPPRAGTLDPLTVDFPEPMDHALLLRLVGVRTRSGRPLSGSSTVDREETRWRFVPHRAWPEGDYHLVAGTILEDLAGNTLNRPFEVDTWERHQAGTTGELVRLPFRVSF